jgi:very-long-chain ceramide synthase
MNTAAVPAWLPTPLAPLFSLSYPTNRPPQPDAFPASNFYGIGLLDGWMLVSMIAFMAIARDISRIYLLEPFARWKLMRDMRHGKRLLEPDQPPTNGTANGNGHTNGTAKHGKSATPKASRREMKELNRRVLRFAEQGWQVIYYVYQWSMGLVSFLDVVEEARHTNSYSCI